MGLRPGNLTEDPGPREPCTDGADRDCHRHGAAGPGLATPNHESSGEADSLG